MKISAGILTWTPRILCILAILFISLFALDSFSEGGSFWQNIGAFLMHLIPSFVLLAILLVAWKWPKAGGSVLLVFVAALGVFVFNLNYNVRHFTLGQSAINVSLLFLPFILSGILFLISGSRKKKEHPGAA